MKSVESVMSVPNEKLNIELQNPSELHFDHQNPRLAEYGITPKTPEEELLKILWDAMDVRELVQSISASGFFQHEALIVTEENGKKIVIEGNRRLAALKVLLNPEIANRYGWEIEPLNDKQKAELQHIPVIFSTRSESWRFLGFKHVNGPAKWSSFAKAKYIAHVHNDYGISLSDIALQIGDGFGTVKKLYRGLMVLEQADKTGVYKLENRYTKRLSFSHLYTGIQYQGFKEFLGLSDENDENSRPVPEGKLENLREVCTWLYGDKATEKPPAIRTQNPDLRKLNSILANREAVAALRDGGSIERAFEFTRPPAALFEEALLKAKRELLNAKSHLAISYDKDEGLLKTAGTIATLADSIYEEMARMWESRKKQRLTEEN